MSSPSDEEAIQNLKVLSLEGGGVRGLFSVSVLAEIENTIELKTQEKNVKISEYFDLITGTSIGGVLALGLAAGKSARELKDTFRKNAQLIFPVRKKRFWRPELLTKVSRFFKAPYDSAPLATAIAEIVGESTTFDDLNQRVMIPAVNLSTGAPLFFKTPHNPSFTRDRSIKLLDAALATSAAPTYFAPHFCEELNSYFADGGLVANNPSFVALFEVLHDMKSDFPNATVASTKILNIGTLGEKYTIAPKSLKKLTHRNGYIGLQSSGGYFGLWGVGERLVLSTMAANQLLHKDMLRRELIRNNAENNYIYLDDSIPNEAASDITLDNSSTESLENLIARGQTVGMTNYTQNNRLKEFFTHKSKPFKS